LAALRDSVTVCMKGDVKNTHARVSVALGEHLIRYLRPFSSCECWERKKIRYMQIEMKTFLSFLQILRSLLSRL